MEVQKKVFPLFLSDSTKFFSHPGCVTVDEDNVDEYNEFILMGNSLNLEFKDGTQLKIKHVGKSYNC